MNDGPGVGLDRRDLLRRGALVGGAVVWTTPLVQSIGGVALASTGSQHETNGGGSGGDCVPSLFCWIDWLELLYCVKWTWTPDCRRTDGASAQDLAPAVQQDSGYLAAFTGIYGSYTGRYGSAGLGSSAGCSWTSTGLRLTLDTSCVLRAWFLCSFPTVCEPTSTSTGSGTTGSGTSGSPTCHWSQAENVLSSTGAQDGGGRRSGPQTRSLLAAPAPPTPQPAAPSSTASPWGPALPAAGGTCDFTFA